jgi:crotonobetainyl-CoA:carnitine CoA-transferase CaiB-like acyl-CoA transferase
MGGPLAGLTVVSVEQAVAAPLCTARLADAGARVIKVERSEGDFARAYDHVVHGESAYFVWLNRGKESIVLDFKRSEDAALLHRMIERADILVQNLSPGAMARSGFDSAELRARYPRLITCDISGYGEEGPARDMKAYDLLIQCETGLASITGAPEAPGRVGMSVADIGCGMNAHAAILEALYDRARHGAGRGIAVSLFDSLAEWLAVPLLHQDYGGKAPARVGLAHPGIAPYGAFATRDGKQIVVAVQNEREWNRLCRQVLDSAALALDTQFASNSRRVENRALLDNIVSAIFAKYDADAITARLRSADIAHAAVNTIGDLSRHPHLRRITVGSPSGPVDLPAPPARTSSTAVAYGPSPVLDADGDRLRMEFAEAG